MLYNLMHVLYMLDALMHVVVEIVSLSDFKCWLSASSRPQVVTGAVPRTLFCLVGLVLRWAPTSF